MRKAVLSVLCAVFCIVVLSCASSGGAAASGDAGFGEGIPYVGEWVVFTDENDNGNSTIKMDVTEKDGMPAYRITGNVTTKFIYGFVGWMITPDAETLENLKNARAISFKFVGDGKRQTVKYRISNVKDYAHFEYHFFGDAGVEERVEVPVRFFQQPSWGIPVRMNKANVEDISWQTHESWRPGTFEITIWDVRVHL
ncbi:MAG: CIA30 family protein [Treponema sp.]|jgi:hypothetical protein|nr:CIA30 family protein [Treponema sp.]